MHMISQKGLQYAAVFYRHFKSARMTAIIIGALVAIFLTGLIIPQKTLYPTRADYDAWKKSSPVLSRGIEFFRLNEISISPVTLFFLSLFLVNLVVVIGGRVPRVLRRAYLVRSDLPAFDPEMLKKRRTPWLASAQGGSAEVVPELKRFLRKRLWSFKRMPSAHSFLVIKNRFSPIGFLLFHVSFLLCLAGGLLVMYTRFSGNLVLTEGQAFDGDIKQFRRINRAPAIFKALPPVGIDLESVQPHYEKDVATDLEVRMKVKYWQAVDDVVVKINEPVTRGPVSILATAIGVSPLFTLRAPGGKLLDGGYVSLNVLSGAEDSFQFEGKPYTFFVRFYPDYAMQNGRAYSRSKNIDNPVFHVRIEQEKKNVYEGDLRPGERAPFNSLNLALEDIRYWADFLIIREYGNVPLLLGVLFGAIGLVMRLIFYQKTLHLVVEDSGQGCLIWINGWSEYYQHSFAEELATMQAELKIVLERKFGSIAPESETTT